MKIALAILVLACGEREQSPTSLRSLEAHLDCRRGHGEGPDVAPITQEVFAWREDDCVAVRVIPGAPRRVVVVVQTDTSEVARSELDDLMSIVDATYGAGDADVGIGIKDELAYRAVAVRRPDRAVQYGDDAGMLERLLRHRPGPEPSSTIEIGSTMQGSIAVYPRPQPAFHLTLSERHLLRVELTTDRDDEGAPIAVVCGGHRRAASCTDDVVFSPRDDVEDADVYDLDAGRYTIAILRMACDEEGRCGSDRARYTLRLF